MYSILQVGTYFRYLAGGGGQRKGSCRLQEVVGHADEPETDKKKGRRQQLTTSTKGTTGAEGGFM